MDDRDDRSVSVFSNAPSSGGTVSKAVKLPYMYNHPNFGKEQFLGLCEEPEQE